LVAKFHVERGRSMAGRRSMVVMAKPAKGSKLMVRRRRSEASGRRATARFNRPYHDGLPRRSLPGGNSQIDEDTEPNCPMIALERPTARPNWLKPR
jgi:hypothetical protein